MRHAIILMLVTANALAAIEIKTNTATKIVVGPFLDATDGLTPKTTLTVGDIDAELVYQSGGSVIVTELTLTASGGDNDMVLATGSENGYWALELTAAQTNFVGHAKIGFYDPNDVFVPVWNELSVISANYWDTKYGTDKFDVNVSEWSGTSVATPDTAGYPKVTIKSGTGAGELSITSGRAAADAILIEGTDATDMIGQAVWNDTSIRTLTAIDEDNTTLDINAAVGVALSDIGLDHLLSAAVTGTDVADNSLFAKLVSASTTADWDDYDNTTDSLQAIRDRGDSAWAAAGTIEDVWTYTTRELTALDEDRTTIDLDGTTIGTATNVTNVVSANITQVDGSSIGTPNVAGYLPVDSVYVVGETPLAAADVTTANATALSNIYLDHLMANALTDPNNVADNSVLAKLASATAAWATFNSASHSLEAIANSIIPPPPSPDLTFTVVETSTPSMVTIQVGDVAIPANFWKDCLVRVDHTDWSAGAYSRVSYSTAQASGKVILYLSPTLPFTPSALSPDKVYIEAWGLRPADLPPRGPITY